MTDLPEFLVQNPPLGDPQSPPPYRFEDVGISIYVVEADGQKLQASCDYFLNRVLARNNSPYRVAPLRGNDLGLAYIELLRYGRMYSAAPGHERLGYSRQNELLVAIPVVLKNRLGMPIAVGTFTPIVIVDQGLSLVTGRDVAGFPKIDGTLELPDDPWSDRVRSVSTLAIKTYASDTQVRLRPLLKVRQTADTWETRSFKSVEGQSQTAEPKNDHRIRIDDAKYVWPFGPVDRLFSEASRYAVDGRIHKLLKESAGARLASFGLKQFRDAEIPDRACYQEIVRSDTRVVGFHGGGVLPSTEIEIHRYDSIDIADSIGIYRQGQIVKPLLGFWYHADFNLTDFENMTSRSGRGRRTDYPDCYDHWATYAELSANLVRSYTRFWLRTMNCDYWVGNRNHRDK